MSHGLISFTGRVESRSGEALAGATVEIIDRAKKVVLAAGFAAADGAYRIAVRETEDPRRFAQLLGGRCWIRVRSGSEALVAERRSERVITGRDCETRLRIPAERARRYRPPGRALERRIGPVLDPGTLDLVDAAITTLPALDAKGRAMLRNAARCPLPPLAVDETLMDAAWGAVQHETSGERRFRDVLEPYLPPTGASLERDAAAAERQIARAARSALVPRERTLLLFAAARSVARDEADAQRLTIALERGLYCPLPPYERLVQAASGVLTGGAAGPLRVELQRLAGECGPDDGPLPPFPVPHPPPLCPEPPEIVDPSEEEFLACLQESKDRLPAKLEPYVIDSIDPIDACPGELVTIRGSNFGTTPGEVCFPGPLRFATQAPCTIAEYWSDTEIRVVVPDDAGSGEVSLRISEGGFWNCEFLIPLFRPGSGRRTFLGGVPKIGVSVDGRCRDVCVAPGTTATVAWDTSRGGSGTTVRLTVRVGGATLLDESGLPAVGSRQIAIPPVTSERALQAVVRATNPCGTVERTLDGLVTVAPVLTIEGIEVTQGIQRFWRPGVVWNSLATVAGKDTIARVYVSCDRNGFNGNLLPNVTGILVVDGTILSPINGVTPGGGAANPFITARPRSQINRGITNHTLNFRIPAALASGTRRLLAVIQGPASCGTTPSVSQELSWNWTSNAALRVRYVRVRDNRAGGTGQRPTDAQSRFTVQRGFDLLASPPTDIAAARTATWNTTRNFTTLNGLNRLLDDLDDEHNCSFWEWLWGWSGLTECPSDDEAVWVGLTAPFNRGIANRPGNTAISAIHQVSDGQGALVRIKTAHEIAHNLSMRHVNRTCGSGTIGGEFYNHPNNGNLQDVPFDPFWNQAVSGSVQDFMSYGCTRWTSADSWNRLLGFI